MTSNITKNFKAKSALRMADGGQVKPAPKPAAAAYSFRSRQAEIDAALADPAKKPATQPEKPKPKTEAQKKRSALQDFFGLADGGDVEGPGGPTDDKVGPVMLSNGEYVLPADTVEAVGVDKLDALRDATHEFVGEEAGEDYEDDEDEDDAPKAKKGKTALREMADGGLLDWTKGKANDLRSRFGGSAPAPEPAPAQGASTVRVNPGAGVDSRVGQAARGMAPVNEIPANRGMVPYKAPVPSWGQQAASTLREGFTAAPKPTGLKAAAGAGLGRALGAAGAIYGVSDMVQNGVNATNVGDTLVGGAMALGRNTPVGRAATGGWAAGRLAGAAIDSNAPGVADAIGGTVNEIGLMAGKIPGIGKYVGWGDKDPMYKAERDITEAYAKTPAPGTAAAPAGSSLRPVESTLGKAGVANEKPPTGPQYYADLERLHQQELAARAAGNREAGARMTAAGGPGAYYQGAMENRSGLANGDPRINGSTSAAYNALGDDAVVGSYNGRILTKKDADARAASLQTASFMPQRPSEDPLMGEIRSALRSTGSGRGGNSFSGRDSGTDEINKRYDDLLRNGTGQNRVKGLDWSQRHGLDVERARAAELGNYASNKSALRGQDISAANAADQNRTQLTTSLLGMQAAREKALADGQSAAAKAAADAAKQAQEQNQQGYTNFIDRTKSMFVGPDGPDAARQQDFINFVSATDPKYLKEQAGVSSLQDLFSLPPQEQMAATQQLMAMADMQAARNASVGKGVFNAGNQMTGFDAPVGAPREYSLRDVASGNLAPSRYAYNFINPLADDRVQPLASGSVVPYDEYVGKSADREKARQSNLRNP